MCFLSSFATIFQCLDCCSIIQLYLTLCDPVDCSTQVSLSFTISPSLLKFTYIESMMPFNYLILCCPQSPFALSVSQHQDLFLMSLLFASSDQSIGASALASVLPMDIQNCFPLGLTGLISLLPKGLSRVFSNTTV